MSKVPHLQISTEPIATYQHRRRGAREMTGLAGGAFAARKAPRGRAWAFLCPYILLNLHALCAAQTYSVTDLGQFSGIGSRVDTAGQALNDRGEAAGTASWFVSWGMSRAFVWDQARGMWDPGQLWDPFCDGTLGSGINNNGQVVGASQAGGCAGLQAFLWTPGATDGSWNNPQMKGLGGLGGAQSVATSVNDSAQVVGWSTTADGRTHAFLYSAGQLTDLGTLGGDSSEALAINSGGEVVGRANTSDGQWHAFLYRSGTMSDLGVIGGANTRATAINDRGQVVINCENGLAFLYSVGATTELGSLGGGRTEAYGINELGQVVGRSTTGAGTWHAFLWSAGLIVDLNDLIPPDSGWFLGDARDINNVGQVLVWDGIFWPHTLLLTPNYAPNEPQDLAQLREDGTTQIAEGTSVAVTTILLRGILVDPEGDQVRLEVELRRVDELPFANDPTPDTLTGFVPSGTEITIMRHGLIDGEYRWQYRVKDGNGNTTQWTEFGVAGTTDFAIDTASPIGTTDLDVSQTEANSVTLAWTAPADGGSGAALPPPEWQEILPFGAASAATGGAGKAAAQYDIRYSTNAITADNWEAAARCPNVPTPKTPGTQETFLVTGLTPATRYWFALKSADEAGNWSALSNVADANTLSGDAQNRSPNVPDMVSHFAGDGTTEIPEGGTTTGSTVVFKARLSDPDGDQVRLEIELRRTDEQFTGQPTPETIGSNVPSGTEVTITRDGLTYGAYRWQYRAKDSRGGVSQWSQFGTSGNTDFTVSSSSNRPPDRPSNVGQFKADATTPIAEGGSTLETTVVFKATVSDPDGDQVRLQIELRRLDEPNFTGEPTLESDLVPSASVATIVRSDLIPGNYHWRYRAEDMDKNASTWKEFGGTGNSHFNISASDLSITTAPLEFFNDEPPFLPNVLQVRAKVANHGTLPVDSAVVNFYVNNTLIESRRIDPPLNPGGQRDVVARWELKSNIDNATLKAEVVSPNQQDSTPSDNAITQLVTFYWVDSRYDPPGFRLDRDAFSFQNSYDWTCPHPFPTCSYWDELVTVAGTLGISGVVQVIYGGWYLALFGSVGGHCFGMASSSVHWYLIPEDKPIPIPTYEMTLEQDAVKLEIIEHHWSVIFTLPEILQEMSDYDPTLHYARVLQDIRSGLPVVLALWQTEGSVWPKAEHAAVAYAVLETGSTKRVYVYDNDVPLKYKDTLPQYATYDVAQNRFALGEFDKVVSLPLEYSFFAGILASGSKVQRTLSYSQSCSGATLKHARDRTTIRMHTTAITKPVLPQALVEDCMRLAIGDLWAHGQMLVVVRSPAFTLLTDKLGRRIGHRAGSLINDFADGRVVNDVGTDVFCVPLSTTYFAEIVGTETGNLRMDVVIPTAEAQAKVITHGNIPVAQGSAIAVTINTEEPLSRLETDSGHPIGTTTVAIVDANDISPPSSVEDLACANSTANSATLVWTAPGDDGDIGVAAQYDIRYSSSPITEATWDAATQCQEEPKPKAPGSTETFVVNGLAPATTYFFAIKAADEIPNWSSLSNVCTQSISSQPGPPCCGPVLPLATIAVVLCLHRRTARAKASVRARLIDTTNTRNGPVVSGVQERCP